MAEGSQPGSDNGGGSVFSDVLSYSRPVQRQTQDLLSEPGNWLRATASNLTNDLGPDVLPLTSFLHNPGQFATTQATNQGRELLGQFRSQLTGVAEQPFTLTQDGTITGHANLATRSLFINGTQPDLSFSGRLFQESGTPLGAGADLSVTGRNFGFNIYNLSGVALPRYDLHGQSTGPGWVFDTPPTIQYSADSHSAGVRVQTGGNNLSFGIQGSEAMTAPYAFHLNDENRDTGTTLSLLTDGRHISQFNAGQTFGPVRLGYEGNLRNENSLTAGISTNLFDCNVNANGRHSFGAGLSTTIWPGARLEATVQQQDGHPNWGLNLRLGGSNQSD